MHIIDEYQTAIINEFRNTYAYLSNFYHCRIIVKERKWPSAEHLYQAMKIQNFKEQEAIRTHPAKGLKAFVRIFGIRSDWSEVKDDIMYRIVKLKFNQNPNLREQLCSTGETELVEGNYWHDNYWGDCQCTICSPVPGKNKLGKILMRVREELSEASGYITSLKDNEIFVFGSNEAGRHGKGAAKFAREKFGARHGIGSGPTGRCYAIPTKDSTLRVLPPQLIKIYVDAFTAYAKDHPDLTFLVTEIGCGLAGYNHQQIAPLFVEALYLNNVRLPKKFIEVLEHT